MPVGYFVTCQHRCWINLQLSQPSCCLRNQLLTHAALCHCEYTAVIRRHSCHCRCLKQRQSYLSINRYDLGWLLKKHRYLFSLWYCNPRKSLTLVSFNRQTAPIWFLLWFRLFRCLWSGIPKTKNTPNWQFKSLQMISSPDIIYGWLNAVPRAPMEWILWLQKVL